MYIKIWRLNPLKISHKNKIKKKSVMLSLGLYKENVKYLILFQ